MANPRYAIYFTPQPSSPLARFGASVLGYDCFDRVDVPHPETKAMTDAVFARITAEPRKYGFHATLVAPFHIERFLEADLLAAVDDFARYNLPVDVGPLAVDSIGAFIALKPKRKSRRSTISLQHWSSFSIPIAPRSPKPTACAA